ncbi:MAG: R3H domain-containing nucleic acid-binding protein [Candidatus Jorgensenbacteria bacterium]|nr:R3H domain-containing nucleic acid-binding protein [Candidatus Jorgensenbacteria bacterium]
MEPIIEKVQTLLSRMGFSEVRVELDEEHKKIATHIGDGLTREEIGFLLPALEHVVNLMTRQEKLPSYVVDVNYYRKERERLIAELARAAARKAVMTKEEVELPAMNAYERRLVHVEIATHPELRTESVGTGKERRVIIKRLP